MSAVPLTCLIPKPVFLPNFAATSVAVADAWWSSENYVASLHIKTINLSFWLFLDGLIFLSLPPPLLCSVSSLPLPLPPSLPDYRPWKAGVNIPTRSTRLSHRQS